MDSKKRPLESRPDAGGEYELVPDEIKTDMDPNLQDVRLRHRDNQEQQASAVTETTAGETIVDVIARVKDPAQDVPGLRNVRRIGPIFTASARMEDIESIKDHPNVASLKLATEIHHDLNFSVPEAGLDRASLQRSFGAGVSPATGRDVIVGIVDSGLDFVHNNFRNADGSSRVLFLWDQRAPSNSMAPAGFHFGREIAQVDLDTALRAADPYVALGYKPRAEAHGTHVTDIAAGNGRTTGNPGVAPEAGIIFVELHGGDVNDDESFGNSKTLLNAVDYIFEKARQLGRPCVVNLSLGTHGGPHDGTTLAEQGFDHLLQESGRTIVVSAGNAFERSSHAAGTIHAGQSRQLTWRISNGDFTDNEMEVWYPGDATFSVTLISPSGSRMGPVQPGNTVTIRRQGVPSGRIISRQNDPNNHANVINIILSANLETGSWTVELTNTGTAPAAFDAWIERDDFGQSRFAPADDDRARTLGSISCGQHTIAVGSYQATVTQRDISSFSASGPTRDGRQKPEVSAPGDMIRAARSLTQGSVQMSGTSMAAPHVTGLVALVMQSAGRSLTPAELRQIVMTHARSNPPAGGGWNPRYGFGRIGAASVLAALPAAPPATAGGGVRAAVQAAAAGGVDGAGMPMPAFEALVEQVAAVAGRARSRISIQIEIEPTGKA